MDMLAELIKTRFRDFRLILPEQCYGPPPNPFPGNRTVRGHDPRWLFVPATRLEIHARIVEELSDGFSALIEDVAGFISVDFNTFIRESRVESDSGLWRSTFVPDFTRWNAALNREGHTWAAVAGCLYDTFFSGLLELTRAIKMLSPVSPIASEPPRALRLVDYSVGTAWSLGPDFAATIFLHFPLKYGRELYEAFAFALQQQLDKWVVEARVERIEAGADAGDFRIIGTEWPINARRAGSAFGTKERPAMSLAETQDAVHGAHRQDLPDHSWLEHLPQRPPFDAAEATIVGSTVPVSEVRLDSLILLVRVGDLGWTGSLR